MLYSLSEDIKATWEKSRNHVTTHRKKSQGVHKCKISYKLKKNTIEDHSVLYYILKSCWNTQVLHAIIFAEIFTTVRNFKNHFKIHTYRVYSSGICRYWSWHKSNIIFWEKNHDIIIGMDCFLTYWLLVTLDNQVVI